MNKKRILAVLSLLLTPFGVSKVNVKGSVRNKDGNNQTFTHLKTDEEDDEEELHDYSTKEEKGNSNFPVITLIEMVLIGIGAITYYDYLNGWKNVKKVAAFTNKTFERVSSLKRKKIQTYTKQSGYEPKKSTFGNFLETTAKEICNGKEEKEARWGLVNALKHLGGKDDLVRKWGTVRGRLKAMVKIVVREKDETYKLLFECGDHQNMGVCLVETVINMTEENLDPTKENFKRAVEGTVLKMYSLTERELKDYESNEAGGESDGFDKRLNAFIDALWDTQL